MNELYARRLKELHKRFTTARDCEKDYANYRRCCDIINDCIVNNRIDRERVMAFINEMSNEYRQQISICSLGRLEVGGVDSDNYNDNDLLDELMFFRDNIIYFAICNIALNMMG